MDFFLIDIAVRGATTGGFFILASLLAFGPVPKEVKIAFALMSVSVLCRLWGNSPSEINIHEDVVQTLRYIGAISPFFFTWFILVIFVDDRHQFAFWLGSAAIICIGLMLAPIYRELALPLRLFAVVHFGSLMVIIIWAAREDLLSRRRRARPSVAVIILLSVVFNAMTLNPMIGNSSLLFPFLSSLFTFIILIVFTIWSFKVNTHHWIGETTQHVKSGPSTDHIRATQAALARRIESAMHIGIWRKEGLTVGGLALEVNAPEHQVRKAINQTLGYRNFSSFINHARIEAAKIKLTSHEMAATSVQEVAYEVGFSSLGPFNRAFRESTGFSPSEYRAVHLAKSLAESKNLNRF